MRLLVVDDEKEILQMIPLMLPEYTWVQASGGQEAIQLAREELPSLVLLDWRMPGMDGMQVLQAMKADPMLAAIPVVMLSAMGQQAEIKAGLKAGALRYFIKPFDIQELQCLIKEVLAEETPPEQV